MATISGVNMMADEIRKSLPLSEEQWWRLNEVAATTESTATAGPTCGQPSWRALIRRIADGELEVRTVTAIEVTYSISTNENDYTDDEAYHEYVPALVDRIEDEVTAYMAREYPDVEFDTRRVPETESYSNRSYPYSANEPGFAIIEELDNFVGNNWPDWFNEAAGAAEEQVMAFTKHHARENTAIFEAACLLVENDDYATARARFKSGELVRELARRFPDVTRKRLRQQAAKAVRRRPLSK